MVATDDVSNESECENLIREANKIGLIESIFNLGVVLRDKLLENQTVEDFTISFGPKAYATKNLDEVSRRLCPELRYFYFIPDF